MVNNKLFSVCITCVNWLISAGDKLKWLTHWMCSEYTHLLWLRSGFNGNSSGMECKESD